MIDNYDSFTYNLVQYLGELGADVEVRRNDEITLDEIKAMGSEKPGSEKPGSEKTGPERIMISPGPCTPDAAGISMHAIKAFAGKIPILGVCLGHQCIGQVFGGKIIHAKQIMHGKTSRIYHKNNFVFSGLKNPYIATRYHSLVIEKESLPDCLEITAWTQTETGEIDEIMGVRHKTMHVEGVQFHPESILTEHGHDLLNNFLKQEINC